MPDVAIIVALYIKNRYVSLRVPTARTFGQSLKRGTS